MTEPLLSIDRSPAALENEVAKSLREVLRDRGLTVRHNGTATSCAPGLRADVEMFNDDVHINVEVTKLLRVAQTNSEATPVPAHLDGAAGAHAGKRIYSIFISPSTCERTIRLFHDYNRRYAGRADQKIVFFDFNTYSLLMSWLSSEAGARLRVVDLLRLIETCAPLSSDAQLLDYLNRQYLRIAAINEELERFRRQKLAEKYERLDGIFNRIHSQLRSVCGLGPAEAFHELSKLIFLKMYEEQAVIRESDQGRIAENRFSTQCIETERRRRRRVAGGKHPIIALFEEIRAEFEGEGLFDRDESIDIQPTAMTRTTSTRSYGR